MGFVAVGLAGLLLLGAAWAIPTRWCDGIVVHLGYWAATASIFIALRELWRNRTAWGKADALMLAGLLPAVLLLQCAQPHGWKIEPDEHVIAATARAMSHYHAAIVSAESWKTDSPVPNQSGVVDKRPLAFPALIALVHGASGFRPGNVFAINAALCVFLLFLSWNWGHAWSGRWGGWCAVLMWANLPLAEYVFTGGGNDGFNVTMLLALAVSTRLYLETPSGERLSLVLALALVLLQARYESAVLAAPFLFVALRRAWSMQTGLPFFAWFAPLLLFPTAVIRRVTATGAWDEEMQQIGAARRFGVEYVLPNLDRARQFLFSIDGHYPNAPVVMWIVLCFLPLGLFVIWRERNSPRGQASAALLAAGLASAAVSMGYFWGQWTDPIVARTSLPFFAALLAPLLAAFGWLRVHRKTYAALVAAGLVAGVLFWAVPHSQADRYLPSSELYSRAIDQFLDQRADENDLWISSNPMQVVIRDHSAITFQRAGAMADALNFSLRHKIYQEVFVAQWFRREHDGWLLADGMSLPAQVQLEEVAKFHFVDSWELRISKVAQPSYTFTR